MKIGIYARGLSEKVGGVKEYIHCMTKEIIKNLNNKDQLFIFHNSKKGCFKKKGDNIHEIFIPSKNKIYCDFFMAPKRINQLNLDIIWFPKNVIPFFIKTKKKIVTIHDLAYFFSKLKAYPLLDRIYMKFMIKSSCKRADRIIAISKNTKKEIVNLLKIPSKKIKVIYEAADERYEKIYNVEKLRKIKRKYNLLNKFILFTGGLTPRKNLIRLIKAFNKISQKENNLHLVLTGSKNRKNKELLNLIDENKKIKRIGFVDGEDMPTLYSLAEIYVYPSLYEGFGLPILEAQKCRCPVTCANTTSIPEVGGNSVLYFNPKKTEDIKNKLRTILKSPKLKKDLIKKGVKNYNKFSWIKSANKLIKLMQDEL